MSDKTEDNDVCQYAVESAVQKGMEMCSDGEAREEAAKPFFGLERGEDIDCTAVLAGGLDASSTLEETRKWVHCRSNALFSEKDVGFEEATKRAWGEAADERQPFKNDTSPETEEDESEDSGGLEELMADSAGDESPDLPDPSDDPSDGLRDPDLDL